MKKHILIIFLLIPFFIFSQNDSRFSIGIVLSPDYSYRTLVQQDDAPFFTELKEHYDNLDIPKVYYTAGLQIKYAVTEHISAGSGLQYSRKGYQTHYQPLVSIQPVDPDPALPTEAKFTYAYDFAEIPVFIEFKSNGNKLHTGFSAGATFNYFFNGRVTETGRYYDGHIAEVGAAEAIEGRREFMVSPFISAGLSWDITEKLELSLAPVCRYAAAKINAGDDPLSEYLWNAGIQAGIFLHL